MVWYSASDQNLIQDRDSTGYGFLELAIKYSPILLKWYLLRMEEEDFLSL